MKTRILTTLIISIFLGSLAIAQQDSKDNFEDDIYYFLLAYSHAKALLLTIDVLFVIWAAFLLYRVADEAGGRRAGAGAQRGDHRAPHAARGSAPEDPRDPPGEAQPRSFTFRPRSAGRADAHRPNARGAGDCGGRVLRCAVSIPRPKLRVLYSYAPH